MEIKTRKGLSYKCDVCGHYERNLMNFVAIRGGLLCGSCWRGCGHLILMHRKAGTPKRSELGYARELYLKYMLGDRHWMGWDEEGVEIDHIKEFL